MSHDTPLVHTLPNGLRLVVETQPHASTVAVGIWLDAGARYDSPNLCGTAHFLEHMVFKGTANRTAKEIALEIDRLGDCNASTTRETTSFYAWTLPEQWVAGLDLMADLVMNPRLESADVEKERRVILEEIRGDGDNGEGLALEELDKRLFGKHPFGWRIPGSLRSVERIGQADLHTFWQRTYRPERAVVTVAGNVAVADVIAEVTQRLGDWVAAAGAKAPVRRAPAAPKEAGLVLKRRRFDQVYVAIGVRSPGLLDPDLPTTLLLQTVLGGGSSSRLFQRVREQDGLAYEVYAFHEAYREVGQAGVYAGVNPDGVQAALTAIQEEINTLVADGPTQEELDRARLQIRSHLAISFESPMERAGRNAEQLLLLGKLLSPAEHWRRLAQVAPAEVQDLAKRLFGDGQQVAVVLGPVTGAEGL